MAGSELVPFDRLPDDLILSVAQWLDPRALLRFGACARRMHGLPKEALWRSLCTARCEATPRFRLTPEREQWLLNHVQPDWVARYRFSLREILRTTITTEELQTFNWHFNFTPAAGGRGRATLVRARFTKTHVVLPNYPPLPYMLHTPSEVEAAAIEGEGSTSAGESSGGGSSSPNASLSHARHNRGVLLARRGEHAAAVEDFNAALAALGPSAFSSANSSSASASPNDGGAVAALLFSRGSSIDALGRFDEAVTDYMRALSVGGNGNKNGGKQQQQVSAAAKPRKR